MAITLEEFVTRLGFEVDPSGSAKYQSALKGIASTAVTVGRTVATAITGAVTAAAGAVAGGIAIAVDVGQEAAQVKALSDSVGLSTETTKGLGAEIGVLGLSYENVIDLAEELNNKMGESAGVEQVSAVKDSMKMLGLEYAKIKAMKPEEQFKAIGDAIINAKDKQQAVSAADMLMGGEANKIFGYLREHGVTIDELVKKSQALNLQTAEGEEATIQFARAWGKMTGVLKTGKAYLAGLVSGELTDVVNGITDWAAANKELIHTELKAWMTSASHIMTRVWQVLVLLYNGFGKLADMLGMSKGSLLALVAALALLAYNPAMAAIAALILIVDDLWTYFEGGESVTGDVVNWFSDMYQGAKGWLNNLLQSAVDTFYNLPSIAGSALSYMLSAIAERLAFIVTLGAMMMAQFVSGVINYLASLPGKAASILQWFVDAFLSIPGVIAGIVASIISAFMGIPSGISGALDAAYAVIAGWADRARAAIEGVLGYIRSAADYASSVVDGIGSGISKGIDRAKGLFGAGAAAKPTAGISPTTNNQSSKVDARTVNNYVTVPGGNMADGKAISDSVGKATSRALHANTSALAG